MPIMYPLGGPSAIGPELERSTLDVLSQPFAFSQTGVLDESQFITEAKKRGLDLDRGELEQLHRRGILIPFYRIHPRRIGPSLDRAPKLQAPGTAWPLYQGSTLGQLSDPSASRFSPWPPDRGRWLYYSHYQLLGLRSLRLVLTRMQGRPEGRDIHWDLPPVKRRERPLYDRMRRLAIVLEALSPRYLPRVTRVLRSPEDALDALVGDTDPTPEADFLVNLDANVLQRQAEALLAGARVFDPLGEWHRVVRIANPRRWQDLRNDALLAHEWRIAGELILQFLEDQAALGRNAQLPPASRTWREARHDRLLVDQRERAEAVMDFALSDRPALYVAVEGQTEVSIVTRVLGLAGYEHLSTWISVVDLQGVGGDVNLLARAVAVPRLDPHGLRGARVVSPLTALMVVADPEGKRYGNATVQARTLSEMKENVLKSLPAVLRTDAMRRDLDHLIHLRTWDEEFEFAHFSNTELATAIRKVVGPTAPQQRALTAELAAARSVGSGIKRVWRSWPIKPGKVELAEALWPALEDHIQNPRTRRVIPVVDVVEDALRISHEVRRAREVAIEDQPAAARGREHSRGRVPGVSDDQVK